MESDPNTDWIVMLLAIPGEGVLDGNCADQSLANGFEGYKEPVAGGFGDEALLLRYHLPNDRIVIMQYFYGLQIAQLFPHGRRVFHVGEQDADGTVGRSM